MVPTLLGGSEADDGKEEVVLLILSCVSFEFSPDSTNELLRFGEMRSDNNKCPLSSSSSSGKHRK